MPVTLADASTPLDVDAESTNVVTFSATPGELEAQVVADCYITQNTQNGSSCVLARRSTPD
jgi:hypothetical protein